MDAALRLSRHVSCVLTGGGDTGGGGGTAAPPAERSGLLLFV